MASWDDDPWTRDSYGEGGEREVRRRLRGCWLEDGDATLRSRASFADEPESVRWRTCCGCSRCSCCGMCACGEWW